MKINKFKLQAFMGKEDNLVEYSDFTTREEFLECAAQFFDSAVEFAEDRLGDEGDSEDDAAD